MLHTTGDQAKAGKESIGFRNKEAGDLEETRGTGIQGPGGIKGRRQVVGWECRKDERVVAAGWGSSI